MIDPPLELLEFLELMAPDLQDFVREVVFVEGNIVPMLLKNMRDDYLAA